MIFFCLTSFIGNSQSLNRGQFVIYLNQLGSLSSKSIADTIYSSKIGNAIKYLEMTSKIPSSIHGNFYGKFGFTKQDLIKWHNWYSHKYIKKRGRHK